jgi:hypothetical protein
MPSPTSRIRPLYLFVSCVLFAGLLAGCGNSKPSLGASGQPPFNTAAGEGNLVSQQLVTTFSTGTSSTQTGLDTFYSQTICPSSLTSQNCALNQASLNTTQFGNFDVSADPIANNAAGVKLVDALKLDYTAINVDQSPVKVSGGLAVPEIAPSAIKGIILYFHGTTVQRTNVPSNFTATTNADYTDGTLLAAVWASQGYVVVMPDYIGLGDDTAHVHPYVTYPVQNAQTGLAMLKAAETVLSSKYQIGGNLPLFITGYSEGGAYALQAGHMMQNNAQYASVLGVTLKDDVPLSGFFDLSSTGVSYLFYNMDPSAASNPYYAYSPVTSIASKPYLSAYLALSFANYANIAPTDILTSSFYNYPCFNGSSCKTLDNTYFTDTQTSNYDTAVLSVVDAQAELTGWSVSSNNSVSSLLTPSYKTALQNQDTTNPLYQQLVNADTYTFTPAFPVTLLSLQQDSVVTRVNSDVAYAYFTKQNAKGPYQEILVPNSDFMVSNGEYLPNTGVDHLTELPFISVLILNQFNQVH